MIVRSTTLALVGWLVAGLVLLSGCTALETHARARASTDLKCARSALRVEHVGTLHVGRSAEVEVALYQAEGCEAEREYLCAASGGDVVCEERAGALPWPELQGAIEQARRLLRSASRARCPGSELSVTQESESLFRYEACDGGWLHHCRRGRCERLTPL